MPERVYALAGAAIGWVGGASCDEQLDRVFLSTTSIFRRRNNENSERVLLDPTLTYSEWSRSPSAHRALALLSAAATV